MKRSAAEILREYGPFPGVEHVHGVTFDGQSVWIAAGDKLYAFDPASGKTLRSIDVVAHAGTAFDVGMGQIGNTQQPPGRRAENSASRAETVHQDGGDRL